MVMDQAELESRKIETAIARRIREKRNELNWTLEELAKITGLSKGHLSQIENGAKVPPIATLTKIAFGLQTTIEALITGETPQFSSSKIEVGRVADRHPITHTEASPKSVYESFGFKKQDRVMRACIVTMSAEFPPKPMMHSGQEFVFALEGSHEFYYDGQIYKINPGDTLYFDSDCPHMGRSLSRKPAKVLVVYCNPIDAR
jgi:transcriptional regulator with XRE-family HTH domain